MFCHLIIGIIKVQSIKHKYLWPSDKGFVLLDQKEKVNIAKQSTQNRDVSINVEEFYSTTKGNPNVTAKRNL